MVTSIRHVCFYEFGEILAGNVKLRSKGRHLGKWGKETDWLDDKRYLIA